MQTKAPTLTLTDIQIGEVVFTKGMILDYYANSDGTTTIIVNHAGTQIVKENVDYVEEGLQTLT